MFASEIAARAAAAAWLARKGRLHAGPNDRRRARPVEIQPCLAGKGARLNAACAGGRRLPLGFGEQI